MLDKVAEDGVAVRVLKVEHVVLQLIQLIRVHTGQVKLQSLLPAILARSFLLLSQLFI